MEDTLKRAMEERFQGIRSAAKQYGDLIAQSASAYESRWKSKMPESKKLLLMSSMNTMTEYLQRKGHTREAINSAAQDISQVDNPLAMLFNLMSILIPNFAYVEAAGVQPMPTKTSPIFFPQLAANEARNGVASGAALLGSTRWNSSNSFTSNLATLALTVTDASPTVSGTIPEAQRPILGASGFVTLVLSGTTVVAEFDASGTIDATPTQITSGTVNLTTGVVSITLAANAATGDTAVITFRYDLNSQDPAQARFEWSTINVEANPYRLRSTYSLDNFYQAKKVLEGYNIDEVMSSTVAGYINKEISGNIFANILSQADADYTWTKANPSGVAWALHRLQLLQTFVEAANSIRQNIARSGGNVATCGTELMNVIETFGDDIWTPESYDAEPIGPYVAGTLLGRFKIIKNQDYASTKGSMVYKKDETDASYAVGVYIGLYATDPIALDDLNVVQGMGTQIGETKVFDDSIVSLTVA